MTSEEIQTKWDEQIPTNLVRVGSSRFKNPGNYVRISLSGTEVTAGIFETDVISNTIRDEQRLHKNIKLNPRVAECIGHKPSKDYLTRQSINVRVETNIPETSIPTCRKIKIHTNDFDDEDMLVEYLKNKNSLLHNFTEEVDIKDIEEHTSFSFNKRDTVTFRPVELTPSRPTLMVREETDIQIEGKSPSRQVSSEVKSVNSGTTSNTKQRSDSESSSQNQSQSKDSPDREVGEGFEVSPQPPEYTFDDIVGLDDIKERVRNLTALYDDSFIEDLKSRYGKDIDELLPDSYAMLLYGPPGCGKTMVSHAIADKFRKEINAQSTPGSAAFISVKGSDILASLQGQSESRIEATFEEARSKAGEEGYAILFFDEIETLIPDRNAPDTQGSASRLTVSFLQEMNNIGDNVMVIGATNLPFTIDSAASRRFKTKLFVRHPGEAAMADLWKKNLESLNTDGKIDYQELGKKSTNFTPAEIDAMLQTEVQSDIVDGMIEDNPTPLSHDYFVNKLEDLQPRTIEEYVNSVDQPDLLSDDQMQGYRELENYIDEHK